MSTPPGITRILATSGTWSTLEEGADRAFEVTVESSVPRLVWAATGQGVFSEAWVQTVQAGSAATIPLVPTNLPGWLINGAGVDVSGGKHSHTYTVTIKPLDARGKPVKGKDIKITGVVVDKDGPATIDLDTLVPYTGSTCPTSGRRTSPTPRPRPRPRSRPRRTQRRQPRRQAPPPTRTSRTR